MNEALTFFLRGSFNRAGASFIIDEQGKVLVSYYGKYVGDELLSPCTA
ncbi:hypothetical protein [Pedobacter sp. L105]|nr:hypothetical protein [Pedobacter sp. L105]